MTTESAGAGVTLSHLRTGREPRARQAEVRIGLGRIDPRHRRTRRVHPRRGRRRRADIDRRTSTPAAKAKTIGRALSSTPSSVIVATKGGYGDAGRGKPEILRREIEQSLASLRVGQSPLLSPSRRPGNADRGELGRDQGVRRPRRDRAGRVSKVDITLIERARRSCRSRRGANEYNLVERKYDDAVDYCAREGMVFVPYYPLRADPGHALHRSQTGTKPRRDR